MLFADVTTSFDWTAIALGVLTIVMSALGWAGKRFSGKLDKHMDKVEGFMDRSGKNEVRTDERLKHLEKEIENRPLIRDTHRMVSDMRSNGCGVQQDLERISA